MKKRKRNKFFYFLFLFIFLGISTGYATLNGALMINGTSNIRENDWNVYFSNVSVLEGSVTSTQPVLNNNNATITFNAALELPGDFYGFTVDIVNGGSLDAMIDSVEKLPELTEEQKRYLNYVIEYQNGTSVSTRQVVPKNSSVKLKVRVEYRSDIPLSEIPSTDSSLSLSFTVNYVQSDGNNTVVVENNGLALKIVSGDGTQIGNELCIRNECFYVISSTTDAVTLLSKYNLYVGYKYDDTNQEVLLENPTGLQSASSIGWTYKGYNENNPIIGVINFSTADYWSSSVSTYPAYVYNDNSVIYNHIEFYHQYLEKLGLIVNEARLVKVSELVSLGCNQTEENCSNAPEWVYGTSYWTGDAYSANHIWGVRNDGLFSDGAFYGFALGIRPVITIPISLISS